MLQIIIWMMCAYFVLKAGEWWLTANASPEEVRAGNRTLAGVLGAAAVALALLFFWISFDAATDISSKMLEGIDVPDMPELD